MLSPPALKMFKIKEDEVKFECTWIASGVNLDIYPSYKSDPEIISFELIGSIFQS